MRCKKCRVTLIYTKGKFKCPKCGTAVTGKTVIINGGRWNGRPRSSVRDAAEISGILEDRK